MVVVDLRLTRGGPGVAGYLDRTPGVRVVADVDGDHSVRTHTVAPSSVCGTEYWPDSPHPTPARTSSRVGEPGASNDSTTTAIDPR